MSLLFIIALEGIGTGCQCLLRHNLTLISSTPAQDIADQKGWRRNRSVCSRSEQIPAANMKRLEGRNLYALSIGRSAMANAP